MKARILCVDDEPFIRTMVAHCVSDLGHTAVEADCGEAALHTLGQDDIDLLITDIRMNGISGWEVAEQARQERPGLPIIYISGYPSAGDAVPGSVYLSKPFRPHELESAVRKCLG